MQSYPACCASDRFTDDCCALLMRSDPRFVFVTRSSIMVNRLHGFNALVAVLLVLGAASAEDPKSGPQVGEKVVPFHPLNCTGDHAGEKYCLICKNGPNPGAIIFGRQVTPELIRLIKRIDES